MSDHNVLDTNFWRLKAHALLYPSPFAGATESAHGDTEVFATAGVDIAACVNDAYDMHLCGIDEAMTSAPPCPLRHPISPAHRGPALVAFADWEQREKAARAKLDSWPSDPEQGRQRFVALWHQAMKDGRDVPASFALPDHSAAALRCVTAALAGARYDGARAALLYLHLGPVQGFISASRRTHDLWVGSFTVGYLTMAAIEAIVEHAGPDAIIFPDLAELPLAQYRLGFGDQADQANQADKAARLRSSLPNKCLAIVAESRIEEVLKAADDAVQAVWKNMAKASRDTLAAAWRKIEISSDNQKTLSDNDIEQLQATFNKQVAAHLELDAVVQPWPKSRGELQRMLRGLDQLDPLDDKPDDKRVGDCYGALYNVCHRVMGAHRKTVFPHAQVGDERPKCSQCGEREQIVPRSPHWPRTADDVRPSNAKERPLDKHRAWQIALAQALSGERDVMRQSYQLARGEGLCAVCWTKRLAPKLFFGNREQLDVGWDDRDDDRTLLRFPGVVTIATAPFRYWLLNVATAQSNTPTPDQPRSSAALVNPEGDTKTLAKLWTEWSKSVTDLSETHLRLTPPGNQLFGLNAKRDPEVLNREVVEALTKHDGEWLYDSNYEPETAWRNNFSGDHREGDDAERFQNLHGPLQTTRRELAALKRAAGKIEPSSYYAILVIDGDEMGKWLTGNHPETPTLDELSAVRIGDRERASEPRPLFPALHRELSRRLGALAQDLHEIVDHYLGRMVYCGGDDVMAFLPLATVLPCMHAIERRMRWWLGERVTYSAGVAIDHMRSPLSRALERARRAEKHAKQAGRDCFTINVAKRSGAPVELTLPWRVTRNAQQLDVLDEIMGFLCVSTPANLSAAESRDDDQDGGLFNVRAVYRLEQEFARLDADQVQLAKEISPTADSDRKREKQREMLALMQNRLATELGAPGRPFIDLVAALADRPYHSDKGSKVTPKVTMRDVLSLLLLLRFLLREQHRVTLGTLLETLGPWPREERS